MAVMDFENPIFLWFLLFLPILYGVVKKVQTTLQVRMQPWLGTTSASEFKRWQEATRRANFLGLVSIAFIISHIRELTLPFQLTFGA